MPMPLWWGQINKRVVNPRAVRSGKWPVIHHIGRSSGQPYRTPIEAHPMDDGFIFVLVYGSQSDWVQNVLAAGAAQLEIDGNRLDLHEPELLDAEQAFAQLADSTKRPPKLLKIDEFLRMRRAGSGSQ